MLRSPQSGRLATLTPKDVVGRGQILITDLLGRLREFAYGGRIAPNGDIDKGQRDAKFHLDFPPRGVAQPV